MRTKVLFAVIAFLLTACDEKNTYNHGCCADSGVTPSACVNGDTRCVNNMLQSCSDEMWDDYTDCADQDKVCTVIDGLSQCIQTDDDTDVGGDADTDADTDADADSDTDSDADTDTDSDADTDTDSDTDTGELACAEYCEEQCADYEGYHCDEVTDICVCHDENTIELGCPETTDCSAECSGYDDYECEEGVCICTNNIELGCEEDSDCVCNFDYTGTCSDGVCTCTDATEDCPNLSRAELSKLIIEAIDGLAGYEAPAIPTFDDVSPEAWYYDYVEAAVQLGIINGYTDEFGNLTGIFGPADSVNRAAGTKIVVNALSVPTDLDPPSIFPDVLSGAWYYDYVVTAYNWEVVDGYNDGFFRPAHTASTCFIELAIERAYNLDPVPNPGTVTVGHNGPVSTSVAAGTNNVVLFDYNVSSNQDLTARDIFVRIEIFRPGGNDPVFPTLDTDYIEYFRIMDTDLSSTVVGPQPVPVSTYILDTAADTLFAEFTMTDDHDIVGGNTSHLSVRADLGDNIPVGYQVRVGIRYSDGSSDDSYFKNYDINQYIPTSNVFGAGFATLYGNYMMIE